MQYDDSIIEVSSSPEPGPAPRRPPTHMHRSRLSSSSDVLILTDTEEEDQNKENVPDRKGKGKAVDRVPPPRWGLNVPEDHFAKASLVNLPAPLGAGSGPATRSRSQAPRGLPTRRATGSIQNIQKDKGEGPAVARLDKGKGKAHASVIPLFMPSSPDLPPRAGPSHFDDVLGSDPPSPALAAAVPVDRPISPIPLSPAPRTPPRVRREITPPAHAPHPRLEPIDVDAMLEAPVLSNAALADYVAQVLDMFPHLPRERIENLVRRHHPMHGVHVLERVLHELLDEAQLSVTPRHDKGKRKRDDADVDDEPAAEERVSVRVKIDYASTDRSSNGGPNYEKLAINHLRNDFPYIPKEHIKAVLRSLGSLYAPAYLRLREQQAMDNKPYVPSKLSRATARKGKERADDVLEAERAWVLRHVEVLEARANEPIPGPAIAGDEEGAAEEEGIECGCCFGSYPFAEMAQCSDAHLFCESCVRSYADAQLGQQSADLVCMDGSGCKAPFSETELRRVLNPKAMTLYDRLTARSNLEKAKIDGLEECPFCEYQCVIENEHEKLFRCRWEECMKVSCRACKKLDHLPQTCAEVDEDKVLNAQHAIEEAMTKALARECPQCKKPFIKQDGCNKIVCTYCRAISCYVCRVAITGYDHFNQRPPVNGVPVATNDTRCPLWENSDQRHDNEVKAAAEKAIADFKEANPGMDPKKFKIDVPVAGPAGPANRPIMGLPQAHNYVPQAHRNMHMHMHMHFLPPPAPPLNIDIMQQARLRHRLPRPVFVPEPAIVQRGIAHAAAVQREVEHERNARMARPRHHERNAEARAAMAERIRIRVAEAERRVAEVERLRMEHDRAVIQARQNMQLAAMRAPPLAQRPRRRQ